jgi:hypothetical protein
MEKKVDNDHGVVNGHARSSQAVAEVFRPPKGNLKVSATSRSGFQPDKNEQETLEEKIL